MSGKRAVLTLLIALGCTGGAPPERTKPAAAAWSACDAAADCAFAIGEGGWPVAVNGTRLAAYQEWVRSQAPFTTYWMPADCFADAGEFEAYVAESRSAVGCRSGLCALEVEPRCAD